MGIAFAVVVLLLVGAFFALNSTSVQNKLMHYATEKLSEHLQTRVEVDSVSVAIPSFDIRLHGMMVEDRSQRKMLEIGRATADIDVWRLLKDEVRVSEVEIDDLKARLIKAPGDTAANYQFVLDAFKSKKHDSGKKFVLDISEAKLQNCSISYNDDRFTLAGLTCSIERDKLTELEVKQLATTIEHTDSNAVTTEYAARIDHIAYSDDGEFEAKGIGLRSDNHRPSKKRGKQLDAGHLDIEADIKLEVKHIAGDSLLAQMKQLTAHDKNSGLGIDNLEFNIAASRKELTLTGFSVKQKQSHLLFDKAHIVLPDKEKGTPLRFAFSEIHGTVHPSDFSPQPSGKQAAPLSVKAVVSGSEDEITVSNLALTPHGKTGGSSLQLKHMKCRLDKKKITGLDAEHFASTFQRTNKKGITTHYNAKFERLCYDGRELELHGLGLHSDNHRPRKNTGKPNKGFFDAGHLDLKANMSFDVKHIGSDSIAASLKRCTVRDEVAGLDIRDVHCGITANKRAVHFNDVHIRQIDTKLHFAKGVLHLPDKSKHTPLHYSTSTIHGVVYLKDIARPFAIPLKNFTIPLTLSVNMSGNNDCITFSNVVVGTFDKRFVVRSNGKVQGISKHDSHFIKVHFDVSPMTTDSKCIETLIKQLPVKRFMMSQMHALDHIRYVGSFDVVWRKQMFRGVLHTDAGDIDFDFTIDKNSNYLSGKLRTDSLAAGTVLNMSNIGTVAATAEFKIDISKERTAKMRAESGGKLPIGTASAHITQASYKRLKTHDLRGEVESDGAVAHGTIVAPEKYADISCSFTFTDTESLHKMKVKPGIKFHRARKKEEEQ